MTIEKLWGMINRIDLVDDPKETLKRCRIAEEYLAKVDCPALMQEDWKGSIPFDEMMEAIAFLTNEAYHRM